MFKSVVSQDSAAHQSSIATDVSYATNKKNIHFPFDFDQWYPRLEKLTFPSQILPISTDTAKAMVKFYQVTFLGKGHLSQEDMKQIRALEKTVAKIMAVNYLNKDVFIRMSNRSPKDGIPLKELEKSSFKKYDEIVNSDLDSNQKMIMLTELQMQNLRCTSAQEVLNLLLSSERVYSDLQLALECSARKEDKWSTSLVIRSWEPNLRQDQEFRLFIYQNQLTAITQYNPYCRYPSLNESIKTQEKLKIKFKDFVEQHQATIGADNYILDIAYIHDEIKVIELNPYDQTTGPCLFSWHKDEQILRGENPEEIPVIRVRQELLPDLDKWIEIMLDEQKAISCGELMSRPYYKILSEAEESAPHSSPML
ncbi:cell division cycle protein 123 family protein [Legionella longbeachae]|uniref:hypothetical protein n=1 Tax=Legionella longbeachae TaxID=450 RepID=UPI0017832601|nr:hypothetical protein [Legionella longbeachae]